MKARTAREKEVVALMAGLPGLTPDQERQARFADGYLYTGKKTGWCSACGHEIDTEVLWNSKRKYITCPHCGARLEVRRGRKMTSCEKYYFTVVSVVKGWQVLRNFMCRRDTRRKVEVAGVEVEPATSIFNIYEVAQTWMDGKGLDICIGRSVNMSYYYNDLWRMDTPMTIKINHPRYYHGGIVAKRPRLLKTVRRNGLTALRNDIGPYYQISGILRSTKAETLAKTKQWALFREVCYGNANVSHFWPSVKIAIRNHYVVKDPSLWFDLLDLLETHGKDLHNAKYVCPMELRKAHDLELTVEGRRLARERAQKEREAKMTLVEKLDEKSPMNVAYRKLVGNMLTVVVRVGDITLQPLQDIRDFYEEGETLHHCVFKMGYYNHKNTLIVGAKVNGQRTETIEIDTANWRIVQCRGKFNQDSAYHQQIYKIATESLPTFAKCL